MPFFIIFSYIIFHIYTGMRKGELLALKKDIDLNKGIINTNKSYQKEKNPDQVKVLSNTRSLWFF